MGFVYAARHAIIDKQVAIKVLRKEAAQDEAAAQRFIVEAKAASKIGHQNIVDITDFGVLPDGHAYFVMEYLDGPTLAKLVTQLGHLPPLRAIAITVQIARGLYAAHNKGIIHRDLKPENIFVLSRDGQDDVVKIVDFGIAKDKASNRKLTQVGMVLGTPEYMSPEQATGQPTDHRVDMYALGCILYEMLTGDVPFKAETSTRTLTAHVFEPVVPPSARRPDLVIPPALEAVVMRTLQKKPTDRYADLRELMVELDRVEAELRAGRLGTAPPVVDEKARATARVQFDDDELRPPRQRVGMMVALGAVASLACVGIVVAVGHGRSRGAPIAVVTAPLPSPAVAPVERPQPAEVELMLRTVPTGAEIFEGAERLGTAPLSLKHARSSAGINLVFKRPGFRDVSRDVVPDRDRDVEVVLMARRPVAAARRSEPAQTPAAAPTPARPAPARRVSDLRNPFE
jgi:serine/threonine-protein kinase